MNIYEITSQGETEWICANTVFQALRFYNSINDLEIRDYDDEDDIKIVPKEKWNDMKITDPEEWEENGDHKIISTFAEFMENQISPDIVASTVY